MRKLLALAGSSNVHEAASAAAHAQALVERHRLHELLAADNAAHDDNDPITDGREAPLESARRPRRWKIALASGLCDVNDCVAYTVDAGNETQLVVLGRQSDRTAVVALWSFLVTRIEWLSATHGPGRSRAWHDAFRIGAAETAAELLARPDASSDDVTRTDTSELSPAALVRLDHARAARKAAVDAFAATRLQPGKGRAWSVEARAFEQGRKAAASLALPVTSTKPKS